MRLVKRLVLETPMTPDIVVSRLRDVIHPPRRTERFFSTKPRLAGQVDAHDLVLYRRRGPNPHFSPVR